MTISRSLLAKAFPSEPRLRAEIESALDLVDSISTEAEALKAQIGALAAELVAGRFQPASDILASLAALPNLAGAVEVNNGAASVRPIDGADQASLLSRGAAYTVLLALGGKGPSSGRPTVPADAAVIYFDTSLGGKPIFNYHGTGWVDSSGTAI